MIEVHGIDTSQLLRIGRSHEVDYSDSSVLLRMPDA